MKTKFCLLLSLAFICLVSCGQNRTHNQTNEISIRDSVLIYKIQGLKEFIKDADYWGDDTESYWAFGQANDILDSISDDSEYDESLARIYAAVSYVSYGLSYVSSVLAVSRQYSVGESDSFPKVGLTESVNIIINDYELPQNDTLYNVSRLELKALYSLLYFYKAIGIEGFDGLLYNYYRSMSYEDLFSKYPPQTAYRLSTLQNMAAWYNLIVTSAKMAYWENHGQSPDFETMPWKEFLELAMWHDALMENLNEYENMEDEEFYRIELKAAYAQNIMLSHIAKNLSELKRKSGRH